MRRLSTTGGTLKLKKGTYKIPGTIYVPSNVKIVCANGVKIKKTKATGTKKVKSTKFLFQMISEEKASGKQNTGKYAASKNASIQGNGKVIFDMGNVNGATAVFVGHASGITVSGVRFRNKKGGSYIWIEGSKNISVRQCVFERKKDVSGLKNRMAVRLETSNQTTSDFSGKWYKKDNTVNKKVKIENNQFLGADVGIGTTKSVVLEKNKQTKEYYQTSITIAANTFTNTKKAPIYAVLWKKPTIKKNVVKRNGAEKRASAGMLGFGVEEPSFTANQISGCSYAVKFDRAKNSGKGKKFPSVMSVIGVTAANKIAATKVDDLSHYYVPNETARILYFRNRTEKNFTITTATEPYQEKYTDASDYTKRKVYYTLMSYMEQLAFDEHISTGLEQVRHHTDDPVVLDIVSMHHEYLNGTGYPNGLQAQDIPPHVRLVSIANSLCSYLENTQHTSPDSTSMVLAELLDYLHNEAISGKYDITLLNTFFDGIMSYYDSLIPLHNGLHDYCSEKG